MRCPHCQRLLVQTGYIEAQNGATKWYFHCYDCEKTFVLLGQVFIDYEVNNGSPSR